MFWRTEKYYRFVYAHGALGGGVDELEYNDNPQDEKPINFYQLERKEHEIPFHMFWHRGGHGCVAPPRLAATGIQRN
jgi:hypothetical protein